MAYDYGEVWLMNDDHTLNVSNPNLGGTGSAQALAMTEEEAAEAAKRKTIPFGFALPEKPKRKRRSS